MKQILRRGTLAALAVLLLLTTGCMAPVSPSASLSEPAAAPSAAPSPTATKAPTGNPDYYYSVGTEGHKGIINGLGQVVLPLQFGEAYALNFNDTPVMILAVANKPSGAINTNDEELIYGFDGKPLSDKSYADVYPITDSLIFCASLDYKVGAMSNTGAQIIPCQYADIQICGDSIIAVSSQDGPGIDIYDMQGNLQCSGDVNFFCVVGNLLQIYDSSGTKFGLVDTELKQIVPADYDNITEAGGGFYIINHDAKYGVVNSSGRKIIPVSFDSIDFYDGGSGENAPFFSATSADGAYVFDSTGKQLLHLEEYVSAHLYGDILIVKDNLGLWHYLINGKDAVPPGGYITWNNEAQILINSVYGACACYNKSGEKLPLPLMKNVEVISPDRLIYCARGSYYYGICATDGTEIVPADYLDLLQCSNPDLLIFTKTVKGVLTTGVINSTNGDILLDGFDAVWYEGGDVFGVIKGKINGLVDLNGNWVWRSDESEEQ